MKRLLLISNGGKPIFFEHCIEEIKKILRSEIKEILLIPYAKFDFNKILEKISKPLNRKGLKVVSIHNFENKKEAIQNCQAILVAGGNTFHLLSKLYEYELLEEIRNKVLSGTPYIGYSAGANIACPNIKTTNDIPIIEPKSFEALNLFPLNINPHYTDPIKDLPGETREERIAEFHKINNNPVIGLRENSMLLVENNKITLIGTTNAKIFQKDKDPKEFGPNSDLSFLIR